MKARRSNSSATAWGAVSTVATPSGTIGLWKLNADGGRGRVDVFALLEGSAGYVTRHTQLLPTLSLSWTPARTRVRTRFTVSARVTDAGEPVPGATVLVDGTRVLTNSKGVANVVKGPYALPKMLAITASKAGYVSGRGSVSIVR